MSCLPKSTEGLVRKVRFIYNKILFILMILIHPRYSLVCYVHVSVNTCVDVCVRRKCGC